MAERQIGVEFQSSYKGDIQKHLEEEKKRFLDFQRWLDANPLSVSVKLDMNGIKAQAASIKDIILGGMGGGKAGASILGADGRAASASIKELSKVQGLLQEINTAKFGAKGGEFLTQVEQIGDGLQRISKFKKDDNGDFQILSSAEKDVRTVKQLEDGLRRVNKELGAQFSGAAGRGDKLGQLEALRKQKAEVDKLVTEAAKGGLVGSAAYTKAENQQDRLGAKIAGMEGGAQSAAEKKARADRTLEINKAIKAEEARATAALKANKLEADQAERLLPDRAKYESEINRIYAERRRIFEQSKAAFQQMDKALLGENRPDLANKAFNRGLGAQSQIGQSDLDLSRTLTDSSRRGAKQLESEKAKQLAADVDAGQKRQKQYEAEQAKRLASDVDFGQKMIREKAAKEREARESAFRREIQDIKAQHEQRLAAISRQEKQELAAAKNKAQKLAAIQKGASLRQDEYQDAGRRYGMVAGTARSGGFVSTADSARGRSLSVGSAAEKDMERHELATRRSGHALDFHSSSLLRNAGTFLRWQIAAQGVMGVQRAFAAGVQGAIRVDRQFATLQTVFHGTAQEAQMLKKETLDLAAAQGRSADEAMDSSIRWSRLGLTRVQVLEATRVSLMAANVAEITAAEAAEKLSGIYATYRLNVGDLADVLNRLNSISNNYNVTVDDMLQGISRVSGVAKQSGLALRDLEGIVASVVGAGGGTGAEVGNALKTTLVNIGNSGVREKLMKAFDIDLTQPNGDLKDMSEILRELATLYPTLNTTQKAYFLELTAGSRQSSRFSKVMTEYRQGQILAAKAGFDHAASLRENEKILQSLESRMQAVKSSWTGLFTSLGDAGFFEMFGNLLDEAKLLVQSASDLMDRRDPGEKKKSAGQDLSWYETAYLAGTTIGKNGLSPRKMDPKAAGTLKITDDEVRFAIKSARSGGMNALADSMQTKLDQSEGQAAMDAVSKMTRNVAQLREELESMPQAAGVFESLGKEVGAGNIDRESMLRQFEAASYLLLQLDENQQTYNDSLAEFRRLANSNDSEGIAKFLQGLGARFSAKANSTAPALREAVGQAMPELTRQLAELEAKKNKLQQEAVTTTNSGRGKEEKIKAVDAQIKNMTATIETLNGVTREMDDELKQAFSADQAARISSFFDEIKQASDSFGEAFKDFAPDADNDPVERIAERQRRASERYLQSLREMQTATTPRTDQVRATAKGEVAMLRQKVADAPTPAAADSYRKEIEAKEKLIRQADGLDVMIKTQIDSEEEVVRKAQARLATEEQILRVKRAYNDAARGAADRSSAGRYGITDSDMDFNESQVAAKDATSTINQAWKTRGTSTTEERAAMAGSALQQEAAMRGNLIAMSSRLLTIERDRKQAAIDTAQAIEEQQRQASKGLQMASREDQLRAAVLSRTLGKGGKLGDNEFSMLSQNSRQTAVSFLPSQAPDSVNDVKIAQARTNRELNAEQNRLIPEISLLTKQLAAVAQRLNVDTAKGGSMDFQKGLGKKEDSMTPATRDQQPIVNVGGVNIAVDVGAQVLQSVKGYLDTGLANGFAALKAAGQTIATPNAQSSTE